MDQETYFRPQELTDYSSKKIKKYIKRLKKSIKLGEIYDFVETDDSFNYREKNFDNNFTNRGISKKDLLKEEQEALRELIRLNNDPKIEEKRKIYDSTTKGRLLFYLKRALFRTNFFEALFNGGAPMIMTFFTAFLIGVMLQAPGLSILDKFLIFFPSILLGDVSARLASGLVDFNEAKKLADYNDDSELRKRLLEGVDEELEHNLSKNIKSLIIEKIKELRKKVEELDDINKSKYKQTLLSALSEYRKTLATCINNNAELVLERNELLVHYKFEALLIRIELEIDTLLNRITEEKNKQEALKEYDAEMEKLASLIETTTKGEDTLSTSPEKSEDAYEQEMAKVKAMILEAPEQEQGRTMSI